MNRKLGLIALALATLLSTVGCATAHYGHPYDNDDYRHDFRDGLQVAQDCGYQDGREVAREDSWHGKPFNSNPRGHNHADRGYRPEFGSVNEYREHYAQAYREGYEHGYQGGYGRGDYR